MWTIRKGTEFMPSDKEFSYMKPERQCYYDSGCPIGWENMQYLGVCRKAFPNPLNYEQAQQTCRNHGGQIAVLHNADDDAYVTYIKYV